MFETSYVWLGYPVVGDFNDDNRTDIFGMTNSGGIFVNWSNEVINQFNLETWTGGGLFSADYNSDGLLDVIKGVYNSAGSGEGYVNLYINKGGMQFVQDSAFSSLKIDGYTETIISFDYDNDGDVDLYIPRYIGTEGWNYIDGNEPGSVFLKNDGGVFQDVTAAVSQPPSGVSLKPQSPEVVSVNPEGAQAFDYNDDGWLDFYAGGKLFKNAEGQYFEDVSSTVGIVTEFDEGMSVMDSNNDGRLDILIIRPMLGPLLYVNEGDYFSAHEPASQSDYVFFRNWGMNTVDLNSDGWTDIVVNGGNTTDKLILLNDGKGAFYEYDDPSLPYMNQGFSIARIDANLDGAQDVLVGHTSLGSRGLAINQEVPEHGALRVSLYDYNGLANQYGRAIHVSPVSDASITQSVVIDGGSGYMSQSEYAATLPLAGEGLQRIWIGNANGTEARDYSVMATKGYGIDFYTGSAAIQPHVVAGYIDSFLSDVPATSSVFYANRGDDTVSGGMWNDELYGMDGKDVLNGGAGDDRLNGGAGADSLDGGGGYDFALYEGATAGVVADLVNPGLNKGEAAGDTYANIDGLVGSGFADTLQGDTSANSLVGMGGNDTLLGLDGNDLLDGGSGNDRLRGGLGDDTYGVDSRRDVVTEKAGEGNDSVNTSLANYTLGNNLENLEYTGNGNFNGTGNRFGNLIQSGGGSDRLNGGSGDDILIGDEGNDKLYGGVGNDILAAGGGDDLIYGQNGDDTLAGGGGNDKLYGGKGADVFLFDIESLSEGICTIADFIPGVDHIELAVSRASIPGLSPGLLAFDSFHAGTDSSTMTGDTRVIYDAPSGGLYYDPDGSGDMAATQFAILKPHTQLDSDDISWVDPAVI